MRWLAVVVAVVGCASAGPLSGRRAPGFSLPDSTFTRYDLQDYRGRWLLIDFMITNCPHCKELSHALEQVKRKYGKRVALLSIVISPPETQDTVANYIKEIGVTIPIVFDQGQVAASYFKATPAKPAFDTPHLFVIDPKGIIVRDYGHGDAEHAVFEAAGLIRELDSVLKLKK